MSELRLFWLNILVLVIDFFLTKNISRLISVSYSFSLAKTTILVFGFSNVLISILVSFFKLLASILVLVLVFC